MPDEDGDLDDQLIPMPQTREGLNGMVGELHKLISAVDNVEVVRRRRIARVNAAADERIAPLVPRIQMMVEAILIAAGARWDEFNKDASAALTIKFTEALLKRNDGKVGKLVVDDLDKAIAFLESLPEPKNFIKTTKDVKKTPVKEWLEENLDRQVPGARIEHTKTITLKIDASPMAQQAGINPHEFSRRLT